jgi:hypothetical protein
MTSLCPIAIYRAVSAAERISFRQINRNRLRQQLVDAGTGETVDRSDIMAQIARAARLAMATVTSRGGGTPQACWRDSSGCSESVLELNQ